jgi:hypothetical protein
MKLLLHRSHRRGLIGGRVIYILDARAHLSEAELDDVATYGLASTQLYERLEIARRGSGLLGYIFRFTFRLANLTVTVRDLVEGKRVECDDFLEILSLEDQLRRAARRLSLVLAAAARFDGDEVVEL